jgi:hypothetical protein
MIPPATDSDPHNVVAVNSGVRFADVLLHRCGVLDLDGEGEGDKGAARSAGKHLKQKWEA